MTSSSDTGSTAGYFKFDEDDNISVATASHLKGGAEFNLLIKSMATNSSAGGVGNSITSSSISEGALNEQKVSLGEIASEDSSYSGYVGQTKRGVIRTSPAIQRAGYPASLSGTTTEGPPNVNLEYNGTAVLTAGQGVLFDGKGILAASAAGAWHMREQELFDKLERPMRWIVIISVVYLAAHIVPYILTEITK